MGQVKIQKHYQDTTYLTEQLNIFNIFLGIMFPLALLVLGTLSHLLTQNLIIGRCFLTNTTVVIKREITCSLDIAYFDDRLLAISKR